VNGPIATPQSSGIGVSAPSVTRLLGQLLVTVSVAPEFISFQPVRPLPQGGNK
jgi:hypothetical protein